MVIIQVAGGLGNQLQQYALYRKFVSLGTPARLDVSWFDEISQNSIKARRNLELDFFEKLEYQICTPEEREKLVGSDGLSGKLRRKLLPFTVSIFHESEIYHPEILTFTEKYLYGYFACEKYYADILPKLREEITFKPSDNPLNPIYASKMRKPNTVAVHIRRGDYLHPENQTLFGNICTDDYYKAAIDYISQRCPGAHFFLFSDDRDYIRKKYADDRFSHIEFNFCDDNIYDMYLMSQCNHIICANSTFSFWGARLNKNPDKIMIRPARHKNTQPINPVTLLPLWQGWVLIDEIGNILNKDY